LEKRLFLRPVSKSSDIERVKLDLARVLVHQEWGDRNQIGLRYRPGAHDPWADAIGSLYDRKSNTKLASESEFTEWSIDDTFYLKGEIESLMEKRGPIGRVRFMRLAPKTGLSVHKDDEVRFHLVLKTNPKAYIALGTNFVAGHVSEEVCQAMCYHIPADGRWWRVDTRQVHWVYNGGDEERIHLVVCAT
jgi:hypothetical protein